MIKTINQGNATQAHNQHFKEEGRKKERTKELTKLRYVKLAGAQARLEGPSASIQSRGYVRTWLGLQVPGK